ncbi:unnamed protein product [Eruca vesicaria subsp. sativa]|uniref:Uncharacterized protein n=1 Tax=Eruca vesicaria subsp. sativa TaxID=29727 RepID=A0ABC8L9K1_ERUVS|nr:unnamed protein product [Eruca vesicaria subsp. sativa]
MLSLAAGVFGTDYDVTDGSDLLKEKSYLRTIAKSLKKDFIRPRTKWMKASESVYPTNALGSIIAVAHCFFTHSHDMLIR